MRSSIARRLATLALVPAVLFGVVVGAAPAEAAVPTWAKLQKDIYNSTNQWRVKAGCAKLRLDPYLGKAARNHSAWMSRTGRFSHVGSANSSFVTRVKAAGYSAPLAENIAWGYRDGAQVVSAWMKSPAHKANIVNCKAKAVGVGAIYAANGTPYYTQDFGSK
jgi:uncharacterized protein YkwD